MLTNANNRPIMAFIQNDPDEPIPENKAFIRTLSLSLLYIFPSASEVTLRPYGATQICLLLLLLFH